MNAARHDIPSSESRRAALKLYRTAKFIENFQREESNLTFVVVLEIKVSVSANTTPGHAFDLSHFNHWMRIRLASMMPDKIVSHRNVKVADFHCAHDSIEANRFT
jgi:hypothetical protein